MLVVLAVEVGVQAEIDEDMTVRTLNLETQGLPSSYIPIASSRLSSGTGQFNRDTCYSDSLIANLLNIDRTALSNMVDVDSTKGVKEEASLDVHPSIVLAEPAQVLCSTDFGYHIKEASIAATEDEAQRPTLTAI